MFDLLINYFKKNSLEHEVILSNIYNFSIFNLVSVLYKIIRYRRASLIMFNLSGNSFLMKTLPVFILSRIFNQKLILRIFGGGIKEKIGSMNIVSKWILKNTVFKQTELILPETKRLINHFQKDIVNLDFFPNIREESPIKLKKLNYNKRLLFLSQVKEEKGIDLILDVKNKLDKSYTIDIYGPILDSKYEYFHDKEFYKGSLPINKVLEVINDYDILLLPTHWPGEGYPGIIIEGYSLGKPIITTKWLAIPEIVDNNKSGILIEPKSSTQLLAAIKNINDDNYKLLSAGALKKFTMFNADIVHKRIYNLMQKL